MSGCHPSGDRYCIHGIPISLCLICTPSENLSLCVHNVPVKFVCAKCIYDAGINVMTEENKKETSDHDERITDLENISIEKRLMAIEQNYSDIQMIHTMRQTIETWQKACEVFINDLKSRVKDIEYRLNHIVEIPAEHEIRLDEVERKVDKYGETREKVKKTISSWEKYFNNNMIQPKFNEVEKEINTLKSCVKEIERFQEITQEQYKLTIKRKHPHKCPVCDFSGAIQLENEEEKARFCQSRMRADDGRWFIWCKSCEGNGIVWG